MDLLGKYLDLPVCLLGDGQQRDKVVVLGYLFYCADRRLSSEAYLDESGSGDPWYKVRRGAVHEHRAGA